MKRRETPVMDRLADLLADGWTIPAAAVRLGISSAYANAVLQRMIARLGEQAR